MSQIIRLNHKYFILGFLVLFFLGGRPVEFGRETVFFQGFPIPKPVIRIALGLNLEDIHIHASSGMMIYQAAGNYKSLADDASDVWVKDLKEALTEIFFVQVDQSRRRDEAEKIARNLRPRIDRPVSVSEGRADDLEGVFQVRVGDFFTRGEALAYIKTLNTLGFPEAWIIREEVTERASKRPWVMVNDELVNLDGRTSLYFIPANPQSYLNYGGKNYRGIFILRGSRRGTILVNVLNLEDYLKSVVPGELSPYYFGEIEALKAQAIAARTYALKNIGQFGDLGFDLYATPQSQVYEGMSLEHPLSSRAVAETKGEVAVYDGMLINALYTSTCGGATENAEAVFGGNAVPYLQSTQCLMESEWGWTLQTGQSLPTYFVGGGNVSRKTAILAALGILAPDGGRFGPESPAGLTGISNLELGPNPYLLRSLDSSASFFLYLDLEPGDAVQWIEDEGQVRLLQVQSIPLSSVVDQPSHYHYWQVRTAREDLEARINEYYPIGKLIDLVPRKHGASQRVIELSVIGRESQVLVTGLKIRQVLNLRDNLFVIDRETDEEGQPTHFLFSGKGWGHGVGLCQVGAFRMAQKGATYEEILKKYYRGIKIDKRT